MKRSWIVVSWLMAIGVLSAHTQAVQNHDTYIQEGVSDADGLSASYYLKSCPQLETIVRQKTKALLDSDITQAAGILRLHFHDCFVQGCDASILLNGSASEQTAPPNLSIRPLALALINQIKQIVETKCPLTVSCSDILTLASREAISVVKKRIPPKQIVEHRSCAQKFMSCLMLCFQILMHDRVSVIKLKTLFDVDLKAGGPLIPFPLGRRDSLTHATVNETRANLPGFNLNTTGLLSAFAKKKLDRFDLVALSGGHTIGIGHCAAFTNRLYPQQDPTLEKSFAKRLYKICPTANSPNTTDLDRRTPNLFDNKYYVNLVEMQGLFTSDETLYTDSRTKDLVVLYAKNNKAFFQQFSKSMIKMSLLDVLTGSNGQIRRQCSVANPKSSPATDTILQVTENEPLYTAI